MDFEYVVLRWRAVDETLKSKKKKKEKTQMLEMVEVFPLSSSRVAGSLCTQYYKKKIASAMQDAPLIPETSV